ncbi:unnamed protein product [Prorocentrum cordatum]|uniref:Uncharacterized protein n=1 Tax=Prorocentrum cordatum TaxID=2364126 RepID=A0ABN9XU49_9DINO|nr:unnamed protein product [Polarella glacialis]
MPATGSASFKAVTLSANLCSRFSDASCSSTTAGGSGWLTSWITGGASTSSYMKPSIRGSPCSANVQEDLIHTVTAAVQSLATKITNTAHTTKPLDEGSNSRFCRSVATALL